MTMTRRAFSSAVVVGGALSAVVGRSLVAKHLVVPRRPDLTLRIIKAALEIAPKHTVTTTIYDGYAYGAPVRLEHNVPAMVEIVNETEATEYVHWHGFVVPAELDGTEEEHSLAVLPGQNLQYVLEPTLAGLRFVHSHAMAMNDLNRGLYSGQFAPVHIKSRSDFGAYDQEIFLTTHEWNAYFTSDEEDESLTETPLHQIRDERALQPCGTPGVPCEIGYGIASINGKALGHGEPIRVVRGERVLFHLTNASATESVRLALPGHRFLVSALDGNPVPTPRAMDVLELGASERVDAVVQMNRPGIWILGSTDPLVRAKGMGVVVEYAGATGEPTWHEAPESTWSYTQFGRQAAGDRPDGTISIAIDRAPQLNGGTEQWLLNARSYDANEAPVRLHAGKRYRFVFQNRTEEDHPLHFHRARFELRNVHGKSTSGVMKDVVVAKRFQTMMVDLVPTAKGPLLFHCHQQMHMDTGFKKLFLIV